MDAHPRGRLIVLEGIDGSGKSLLAQRLVEALGASGHEVQATREPTDAPTGRALRAILADPRHDPFSEALLFAADHAAHVDRIGDWLDQGRTVVSDRYSYSCRAYQAASLAPVWGGRAGTPSDWLEALLEPVELEPDLVLLLDLPVEVALERVDHRGDEGEKFEQASVLASVREHYARLAKEHPFFETLDARSDPDEVLAQALAVVRDRLGVEVS